MPTKEGQLAGSSSTRMGEDVGPARCPAGIPRGLVGIVGSVGAVDRRLAFDQVVRRMTVSVACTLGVAAWFGCGARDARGTQVSIHAVPGGRVTLRLVGPVARGAHDFLLDGRRLSRTRRRAITVAVTPAAADPLARWRLLEVRRAGSRRVLARARFAMGASRSRAAPTLVLLAAPPPRTTDTLAVLRFSFSSRTASCSLDGSRLRPCSSPIALQRSLLRHAPLHHPGRRPPRNNDGPRGIHHPRPRLGQTAREPVCTPARLSGARCPARVRPLPAPACARSSPPA
jgi:hypothetical protein